jgi:HSP20 family molecular chaperone IbpA
MVPKCEFHYFKKKITLPGGIDEKKITSTFSNGRLTIYVPKVFRGHKIKVV